MQTKAKEEGFVSTIFGAATSTTSLLTPSPAALPAKRRERSDSGSAADIMKIAAIGVHRFAAEGIRSKVILQVHDELVVDMLRSSRSASVTIVTEVWGPPPRSKSVWWWIAARAATGSKRIDRNI